jgi:hypothetical protein
MNTPGGYPNRHRKAGIPGIPSTIQKNKKNNFIPDGDKSWSIVNIECIEELDMGDRELTPGILMYICIYVYIYIEA